LAWVQRITRSVSGSPLATPYLNWAGMALLVLPPQAVKVPPMASTEAVAAALPMNSRRFDAMLLLHDERTLSIDDSYDKGMKPPRQSGKNCIAWIGMRKLNFDPAGGSSVACGAQSTRASP
jgi:hypothetical protein